MANKPLKPCQYPGCYRLVPGGYCTEHQPKARSRSQKAQSWHWMYQTPEWQTLRSEQLLREPFCRECARIYPPSDPRSRTHATDVDHIVDHKGRWDVFTDASNLQSLCHSCHSRKTAAEMHKNGAVSKR